MTFDPKKLNLIVDGLGGGTLRIHTYETEDEEEAIAAPNYFTNAAQAGLRPSDMIIVRQVVSDIALGAYVVTVESLNEGTATVSFDVAQVQFYPTIAAAQAARISPVVRVLFIVGETVIDDGEFSMWTRNAGPAGPGVIQSNDGAFWKNQLITLISDPELLAFSQLTGQANTVPYFNTNTTMALSGFTALARGLLEKSSATDMRGIIDAQARRAELDRVYQAAANIASAATTDIGATSGDLITVTGNATIAALGVAPAGAGRVVLFSGTPTLTHNATSLILPGGADIIVEAGDRAVFRSLGGGNWTCISYTRATTSASGATLPIAQGGTGATTAAGARANLGLGTLATQNSNSVNITGGNITGLGNCEGEDASFADVFIKSSFPSGPGWVITEYPNDNDDSFAIQRIISGGVLSSYALVIKADTLETRLFSLRVSGEVLLTGVVTTTNVINATNTINATGQINANGTLRASGSINAVRNTGAAGTQRSYTIDTNNSLRWAFGGDQGLESGLNAGTNFFINRYDDFGDLINQPFSISRATGQVNVNETLRVSGSVNAVRNTGAAGTQRSYTIDTNNSLRWAFGGDQGLESGGTSGTNFFINRYGDSGNFLSQPFSISRATGNVNIPNVTATGTFNPVSDARMKDNIQPIRDAIDPGAIIDQISPKIYRYEWNDAAANYGLDGHGYGVLAHELKAIFPDAVGGEQNDVDENGNIIPMHINTDKIFFVALAEIADLRQRVSALEAKVAALEASP